MNKLDVSLFAAALLACDANGRLWPGLPNKMGGSPTKSWHVANKDLGTFDWPAWFTSVAADATCAARLKGFNEVMDLGGFITFD